MMKSKFAMTHFLGGLLLTCMVPALGRAAIPVGELVHDGPATPEQLSLFLAVTGELSYSTTATVRYRRSTSPGWSIGHPLFRIRTDQTSTGGASATVVEGFAWPVIDLTPGTSYDVEVLVNDGKETVTKNATFVTRPLPPSTTSVAATITIPAGSSRAQIQSAVNGAAPGNIIELEDGRYDLDDQLSLAVNGEPDNPITLRGASRDGAILSNGSRRVLYFTGDSAHFIVERMTLEGGHEDRGINAQPAIQIWDGAEAHHLTFRNLNVAGHNKALIASHRLEAFLIYNNTFIGNNRWEQDLYSRDGDGAPGTGDGIADVDQNIFWNDDGVRVPGVGHAVFNNTFRGFGDSLSFCSHSGSSATAECRAIHFYRNDIVESGDDCAELDYTFRNISMYDNRCVNGMTAVSLDNGYGGPFLIARNIFINIGRSPFKFNGTISGQFLYNNDVILTNTKDDHGWIQYRNGSIKSWGYRNNIFIYHNAEGRTYWNEAAGHDPIDFTHNAWFPDSKWAWNNSGGTFSGLLQAAAGLRPTDPVFGGQSQRHFADSLISAQPFVDDIILGADFHVTVVGQFVPTLRPGTPATGTGIAIPNITDGYTGSAPDRGAVITGRPVPFYGDPTGIPPPAAPTSLQVR